MFILSTLKSLKTSFAKGVLVFTIPDPPPPTLTRAFCEIERITTEPVLFNQRLVFAVDVGAIASKSSCTRLQLNGKKHMRKHKDGNNLIILFIIPCIAGEY